MLFHNMEELPQSLFTGAFRRVWNNNFRRCVTNVKSGPGIRVEQRAGIAVISLDTDTEQDARLDELVGDNVWIQVNDNVIQHTAATVGIGTYNIYPLGSVATSGTVVFHQRVYRHDINGHIMGTHLGGGTIHTENMFSLGTQRRVHQVVFDGTTFREIWSIEWVVLGGGTGTSSTVVFTGTTC